VPIVFLEQSDALFTVGELLSGDVKQGNMKTRAEYMFRLGVRLYNQQKKSVIPLERFAEVLGLRCKIDSEKNIADILSGQEKIRSVKFTDTVKLIPDFMPVAHKEEPVILALGTSWIKGYETGKDQHRALNPLVIAIRQYCKAHGVAFIDKEDADLLSAINKERGENKNRRVIVLAGKQTVRGKDFLALENAFLAGVNNEALEENSYVRLIEMLTLLINLAFKQEIDEDYYDPEHPRVTVEKDKDLPNLYIFIPKAIPMDYEMLKHFYSVQTFA